MNEPIIEITNISKKYNITHHQGGYIALRDILTNVAKSPFKFLKHKAKKIIGKDTQEEFWALKNINFNVEKGDTIGIIGSNGAGKSTLLKILSKITPPTTGEIKLKGSVSSLLEVGTGFHPELTGRENVFLNGAILGMTKKEIVSKFDKIVEFAGINKFLDTPVKRYSSGMQVRLAFSVAAHMEPDILIVDEVLAVGDADFQKKCLGKMDEVTKEAGRTILFVSHNMKAIMKLCNKCVLLKDGKIEMIGETKNVVSHYLKSNPLTSAGVNLKEKRGRIGGEKIRLTSFYVESNDKKVEEIISGGHYTFCYGYETLDGKPVKNLSCSSSITLENGEPLVLIWNKFTKQSFEYAPPKGVIKCKINQKFPLGEGLYNIDAGLWINDGQHDKREDYFQNLLTFEVKKGKINFYNNDFPVKHSPFHLEQDWKL